MHFTLSLYSHLLLSHPHWSPSSIIKCPLRWTVSTVTDTCNIAHLTERPPSPHISLQLALACLFCFTPPSSQWLSVLANSISSPPFCPQWNHEGQDRGDLTSQFTDCFLVLTSHGILRTSGTAGHFFLHKTFSLLQFSDTHALLLVLGSLFSRSWLFFCTRQTY